jgi:transposase InsO family protein
VSAGGSEPSGILSFAAERAAGGGRDGSAVGDSADRGRASAPLRVSADQRRVAAARDAGESQARVADDAGRSPAGGAAAKAFVVTTDSDHDFEVASESGQPHEADGDQSAVGGGSSPISDCRSEFVYLAVILDAFSRKVVGWALDRTLAARLPIAALEQAIAQRQPPPGWCITPTAACSTRAETTPRSCNGTR